MKSTSKQTLKKKSSATREFITHESIRSEGKTELKLSSVSPMFLSVITKSIHSCPVSNAIEALHNTGKQVIYRVEPSLDDAKLGIDQPRDVVKWEFDTAVLGALRSILGPKAYKFRCSRTSTLTSGTGTLTINTSLNLTQYNEGTALVALFEECRMLSGMIQFEQGNTGSAGFSEIAGFYPGEDASTPTLTTVGRLRHLTTFGTGNYVRYSPLGGGELKWSTEGRMWGSTVDEGVSAPRIVSGFNGTLKMIVLAGTPANSILYFGYLARVLGEFRSRT